MSLLRKYATALVAATAGSDLIRFSLRVAGEATYATGADWTPAAGDVKVSLDGGAEANVAALPTYVNGSWALALSPLETTAKVVRLRVSDVAVDDWDETIETFGNAAANYPGNFVHATLDTKGAETIAAYVDTEVAATLAAVDTEVAAIKADTAATLTAVGTVPTAIQNADALFARALPASPVAGSAGEAFKTAAAQGAGDWDIAGDVLTLKDLAGTTLAQFTLTPPGGPYTARVRQ